MSDLLFIAVPGGRVVADAPRLRLVVVPRLGASLDAAGMLDWPATIGDAALSVEVYDELSGPRPIRCTVVTRGRSELWRALFGALDVVPFGGGRRYASPTVSPTAQEANGLIETYRVCAPALSSSDGTATVTDQLRRWAVTDAPSGPAAPPPTSVWRAPDFHAVVANLREHPTVLAALGLIIDIDLTSDPTVPEQDRVPPALAPVAGMVRVTWPDCPLPLDVVPLWTNYHFDHQFFLPCDQGTIRGGLIDLTGVRPSTDVGAADAAGWQVATVDVDGGVARLRAAAAALERATEDGSPPGVPAMRSGGLQLLRHRRADDLQPRPPLEVVDDPSSPGLFIVGMPQLLAEDLMLGYRMDVKPKYATRWSSLNQRQVTYLLGGPDGSETLTVEPTGGIEEGHVKPRAVSRESDESQEDEQQGTLTAGLCADEVVARWGGWSLAVPRPTFDRSAARQQPQRKVPLPFRFDWDMRTPHEPGTLPRLRFGTDYRVRLRVADLAGGGLGLDDLPENEGATELIPYERWEPVAPPTIPTPAHALDADGRLDLTALGPGGAVDRLVVRSDPDAGEHLPALTYPANDRRDLLPPTTTFDVVEQWGALDDRDPDESWELAARAMRLTPHGVPESEIAGALPDLPDPAAEGISVFVHDVDSASTAGQLVDRLWAPPWPTEETCHLALAAGGRDSAVRVDWDGDVVTITLPPGGEATAEVSSSISRTALGWFAIKRWLPASGDDAAVSGRHPMFTPARTLRLVHAVRTPRRPDGVLRVRRALNATAFELLAPEDQPLLGIEPATTAQFELAATWDETIDDPMQPAARIEPRPTVVLTPITITRRTTSLPAIHQELGTTGYRRLIYTATAVSRFRQLYAGDEDERAFSAATVLAPVDVPNSVPPSPPVVLSAAPSFRPEGREVPTGWSTTVGARLERRRLGNRIRVEVERPWYVTGADEQIAVVCCVDPAAAPTSAEQAVISEIGRDPIYDAVDRGSPLRRWLAAEDLTAADAVVRTRPPNGPDVALRPYPVTYREGRCFADVVLPSVDSYCPLVRLGLARYQSHSLEGAAVSAIVRTVFVPLFPDRTLVVERIDEGLRVSLHGVAPLSNYGRTNRVDAALERLAAPPDVPAEAVAITALPGDAGSGPCWVRVATATGGVGSVLPVLPMPLGVGRYRLYVREVERFQSSDAPLVEPAPGGEFSERTVFTDLIALA